MEAAYAKLYSKYSKLKKDKESQFDKLNKDQEDKFVECLDAAEVMIQYLKNENDKLQGQIFEQKKLFMEEKQKNEELSQEITRLKKLELKECSHCTTHEQEGHGRENSHEDSPSEGSPCQSVKKLMKRFKYAHTAENSTTPEAVVELNCQANQHVYADKSRDAPPSRQQPPCCQRSIYSSGGDATDTSSKNCVFQSLVELLIGMKVSPLNQSDEPSILVNHQSSGYSFSLTWITVSKGETELVYRVLSLGTFEKVAPEWLKETIMFGTNMTSLFFERVSRVVNLV